MSCADRNGKAGVRSSWRSAKHGGRPYGRSAEHGFTLVELLVALALFAIAGLALVKLQGTTLLSTATIDRQLIASIVARNVAADALSDPAPPAIGGGSGVEANMGLDWTWRRTVSRTADPRMLRVDVAVTDGERTLAQTTVVRMGALQ